jgi:hypothetical protein
MVMFWLFVSPPVLVGLGRFGGGVFFCVTGAGYLSLNRSAEAATGQAWAQHA